MPSSSSATAPSPISGSSNRPHPKPPRGLFLFPARRCPPPAGHGFLFAFRQMGMTQFLLAFGGAGLLVIIICTARRRGVPFTRVKGTKTRSRGTDSPLTNPFPAPCCAGYERRFSAKKPSVLYADGLNKVSVTHLPPPDLPRFGGGERPPFLCKPIAMLTITMGRRRAVFASPNTPRALLSVSNRPPIRAPFPPSGKGVGGFGAEHRRWRMKRGGESVAVEKIEQTNSAKIFSGTARR